MGTTRTSTAEHQEQIWNARLNSLIAALRAGVLLQDEDEQLVLANDAFVQLFHLDGLPRERYQEFLTGTVAGSGFQDQFSDPAAVHPRMDHLLAEGVAATAEEIRLLDGRVVERDYVPVELDGTNRGHLWVYRDITEAAQIRHGLEDRNTALGELADLKTEFVATASHELRTPLTSIVTFAQLLEDEPDSDPEERHSAVAAIKRNADRLLRLVEELLLLANLEAGTAPLAMAPVDLDALVRSAADAWLATAAAVEVDIVVEDTATDGPRLIGDAEHLGRLMDTLLATTVASTPPRGLITVHAGFEDPSWTIRLAYSGASGDASPGQHLFTHFGRADPAPRAHGNALGVLLGRAIVSRHGGELSVPGTSGVPAFVVRLPAGSPAEP